MKIVNNIPINHIGKNLEKSEKSDNYHSYKGNLINLPSLYSAGFSQINPNLPIAYTKIDEISIPGLSEKASVFKLANGQKVVILPKKGPTFIKTTFNVGSMNETDDIRGISHFIEHNLFNGSKNLAPGEYDKQLSLMGGYTNAYTNYNETAYYLQLQLLDDNSLEKAIMLNANQTQFPTFPVEQLEKEKEPVKSEIDMYKDDIGDIASQIVLKNLFGIKSNAANYILGTKQNIDNLTKEKVFDYYNTWYTPDNAVTVITGDVDVDETINLVAKYYNKKPDYSKINQRYYEPVHYNNKPIREDFIQKGSQSSNISLGFAIPEGTSDKELCAVEFLESLINASNSRLSKRLRDLGLYSAFSNQALQNKKDSAQFVYTSIYLPDEKIDEVLKILYEELYYYANNPPSIEEFNVIKNNQLKALQNTGELSGDINNLLSDIVKNDDNHKIQKRIEYINSLTPSDIQAAAKKFFDLNKISIAVGHKENSQIQNGQKNNISFGKSNPSDNIYKNISGIKQFKLPNNIETAIVPAVSTGRASFMMDIQTDLLKTVSKPALSILNEILNRGSMSNNGDNFQNTLNSKDIILFFDAGPSGISAAGSFYDGNTSDAISIMKDVINNPLFTEEAFQNAKQIVKDNLQTQNKSANDKLLRTLFPDTNIYKSTQEQLEELDKLTLNDIKNLYYYILQNAQCEVTCTAPTVKNPYLTDIINNGLSQGMPYFQPVQINREYNTQTYRPVTQPLLLTDTNESNQADISQAYTFKFTGNIQDEAKIMLLNNILGGGMSSRLFTDLRGSEKLAYSVHSSFCNKNDTGLIMLDILTSTDSGYEKDTPENAKKAIDGFKRNVDKLKTEPVSEEELKKAKNSIKTDILNQMEKNSYFTEQLHEFRNSPYDFNHLQLLFNEIDKVTIADITETAKYVFSNSPVTSIVGSKKTIDYLNTK